MATEILDSSTIDVNNRPAWPYELWTYGTGSQESIHNTEETLCCTGLERDNEEQTMVHTQSSSERNTCTLDSQHQSKSSEGDNKVKKNRETDESKECDDKEEDSAGKYKTLPPEEEVIYEPDHWSDELEGDLTSSPLNTLICSFSLSDISQTAEADQLRSEIFPMLENTLEQLRARYKLFQDSYLLPVGSMAEHSKVGKVDEFDFAVILPILAQEQFSALLDRDNEQITDPAILQLVGDIWSGNLEAAAGSFQHGVRDLWSDSMVEFVPSDWTVLNPSGHSDSHSVAATFHLHNKSSQDKLDMDVCFWIPLSKERLLQFTSSILPQKYYLGTHCLDEDGLAYVILPHDVNLGLAINTIRMAMSRVERASLLKYGPENNRLVCYRICKSLASAFLPKLKKKESCDHCFDSVISSYCLKNVILYMTSNYSQEFYWEDKELVNRVLEVFSILTFCMKVNVCQVSAFFTPYQLSIDWTMQYDPSTKCVTDSQTNWHDTREILVFLPDLTATRQLFSDDPISMKAVDDYEGFLSGSAWRYPEVICRLTELLTNLSETDEEDRRGFVEEPGWLTVDLNMPHCRDLFVSSVDTKL